MISEFVRKLEKEGCIPIAVLKEESNVEMLLHSIYLLLLETYFKII